MIFMIELISIGILESGSGLLFYRFAIGTSTLVVPDIKGSIISGETIFKGTTMKILIGEGAI